MGAIRLFLALVVAVDHFRAHAIDPVAPPVFNGKIMLGFNAGYAVMFFYVISGFLICYTLSRNYDEPAGVWRFYRNRLVRIFSLYWPMAIIAFTIHAPSLDGFATGNTGDRLTQLLIFGQDWRLMFADPFPRHQAAIAGMFQAWTLAAELTFYAFAPILLRSLLLPSAILAVSLVVRGTLLWQLSSTDMNAWTYNFFPSTVCFFMMGWLVCAAADRLSALKSAPAGVVFLFLSAMTMDLGNIIGFDTPRFWVSITLFTAALPGVFEATRRVRAINFLGDLSYPVYLTHLLVVYLLGKSVLIPMMEILRGRALAGSTVAMVAAFVSVGAAAHFLIERPVTSLLRRTPKRTAPASV